MENSITTSIPLDSLEVHVTIFDVVENVEPDVLAIANEKLGVARKLTKQTHRHKLSNRFPPFTDISFVPLHWRKK